MLLNASVAEAVERVEGSIEFHVAQPHFEPGVKLVPQNHLEVAVTVRHLEDGSVAETPVLPVNSDEAENSLDWTQKRVGGRGQRDLVDPFPKLVVLGLGNRNDNAVIDVVAQWLDIFPAEDHLEIDGFAGLGNEIATSEHGEEVDEAEV